jgi:P4 family phage/plasmid primase-like protien
MLQNNLFELCGGLSLEQLKEFMESAGVEFRRHQAFCPFHAHEHKTPSLAVTVKNGSAFFNCFACSTGGDAIKFAELYYKIPPLEAAMRVLDFLGIPYERDYASKDEEKVKEIQAQQQKRREEAEKIKAANKKREAEEVKKYQKKAAELAKNLSYGFMDYREIYEKEYFGLFPNQSELFTEFAPFYIGYDSAHKSLAIINKHNDTVYNIKHRYKYVKNENGEITNDRMDGKWIGMPYSKAYPFPLKYFEENNDNRVIVCEGEKDALNLLSYGVNVLTLGGVTTSWETHKELLRGKSVFIWFDNDEAGYINALKRYSEFKSAASEVYIVMFMKFAREYPQKWDISDWILEKQNELEDKESIFNAITYSSFRLTNDIVNLIEEKYDKNLKEYRTVETIKAFTDITRELLARDSEGKYLHVTEVKGELDGELGITAIKGIKKLDKKTLWQHIKRVLSENLFANDETYKQAEDALADLDKALSFKESFIKMYRQTHIRDIVKAFYNMVFKAGYDIGEYRGSIYFWVGNQYLKIDNRSLTKFILSRWMQASAVDFKKQLSKNAEEVVENIMCLGINLDIIKGNEQRRVINCLNGTLFISKNGKIIFKDKHDKKDAALNILPFNYDPNAKAPKWEKFLNRVLPEKQEQMALMEFIGYCFLPTHEFESFLFLYGEKGANGKSVILSTIKSFFGEENVSGLEFQQLEGHTMEALTGKILNIGAELDKNYNDRGQMSNLKRLVSSSDILTINPKNRDAYELKPNERPKIVFAGNGKPKGGADLGFFRRALIIPCTAEIKDNEKIRDIVDRFKDEMAGILNLALEGLKRLKSQNYFTKSERMIDELEEYKDEVDPLRVFIKEAVIVDKNFAVPVEYLYRLYTIYTKRLGGKELKRNTFALRLRNNINNEKELVAYIKLRVKDMPGLTGETVNCFGGIKLNHDFEIGSITASEKDGTPINIKDMYMPVRKELFSE